MGVIPLDEGTGRLITLDSSLRELSSYPLTEPDGTLTNNVAMVSLPGPSRDLLLISAPQTDERTRVEQMYDLRVPPAVRAEHERINAGIRRDLYGARKLSPSEQQQVEDGIYDTKRGWQEESMGMDALSRALATPPITRIRVLRDGGRKWGVVVDDTLPKWTPGTGVSASPIVYPAALGDAAKGVMFILVPLNAATSPSKPDAWHRGMVHVYQVPQG